MYHPVFRYLWPMESLPVLKLPKFQYRQRNNNGKNEIFDPVRKKWILLSPEEWVRQHTINFLINNLQVPSSLLAIEKAFKFNTRTYRADIVVYSTSAKPAMLVECKAPEVKITQAVFDQVFRYNLVLRVPYFIITNGMDTFAAEIDYSNKSSRFLDSIPLFSQMNR